MIKALIFDFDGLIMDTESPEVEAWEAIYAEYGQQFPLQQWVRDVVGSNTGNFDPAAHLADLTGQSLDLPELHARAHSHRLHKQGELSALPGVTDYIKAARRLRLRLAIASSSEHSWVDGYLRQLGLLDCFQVVICREDVENIKPEPDLFLAALAALKLPPEEALAFEDSPNGILAARRAGLRVVAVPNPITRHGDMGDPDLQLSSLAGLPLENLLDYFNYGILPESPADIEAIRAVEKSAFGRSAEADLVDLCRQRGKVSLSLVAIRDGHLVGHILFTPVSLDPPCPGWHGLGLGPVAVLPEFQRAGIGSSLIRSGLEMCRRQGIDFVVLLGDPRYYSRFGFIPASKFGLGNEYGADEEFMVRELRPGVLRGVQGVVKYVEEFTESGC
jgi:HAD superfamily hydrolase (TIGR01509 family)